MVNYLRLTIVLASCWVLASCAEHPQGTRSALSMGPPHRLQKVRTTAYSRGEAGGKRNAVGDHLSGHKLMSAASDWSRFPLGTRFRIVDTKEEFIIDDYGTALVGTNTIDLYKKTRLEMKRWGVRHVDIDILEWGSEEKSLKVLTPRKKHRSVQKMIISLQKKASIRYPSRALD